MLKVDGSITSNTFVRHRSTLAGMGTINANVMNNHGTVSPGEALGAPGVLTLVHYTQAQYATLMIQSKLQVRTPGNSVFWMFWETLI